MKFRAVPPSYPRNGKRNFISVSLKKWNGVYLPFKTANFSAKANGK